MIGRIINSALQIRSKSLAARDHLNLGYQHHHLKPGLWYYSYCSKRYRKAFNSRPLNKCSIILWCSEILLAIITLFRVRSHGNGKTDKRNFIEEFFVGKRYIVYSPCSDEPSVVIKVFLRDEEGCGYCDSQERISRFLKVPDIYESTKFVVSEEYIHDISSSIRARDIDSVYEELVEAYLDALNCNEVELSTFDFLEFDDFYRTLPAYIIDSLRLREQLFMFSHGDLTPSNVLVSAGMSYSVIDFERCGHVPIMMDLVWFVSELSIERRASQFHLLSNLLLNSTKGGRVSSMWPYALEVSHGSYESLIRLKTLRDEFYLGKGCYSTSTLDTRLLYLNNKD